jgi:hypothetical protein
MILALKLLLSSVRPASLPHLARSQLGAESGRFFHSASVIFRLHGLPLIDSTPLLPIESAFQLTRLGLNN